MAIVCETCGDQGFKEALIYCDSCKIGAVHRYCLGIVPVLINDYITWFCVNCDGSESGSDCKEDDQTAELRHILKKSEEKKKKLKKKNKESSNQILSGFVVDDHGLEDTSNVEVSSSPVIETMEELERRDSSEPGKSDELVGLIRNRVYVLEAGNGAFASDARDGAFISEKSEKEKKKKKKKRINHTLPVLAVEEHGLQDATNSEPVEVSLPTKEKTDASKRQECSDSVKPPELTNLIRTGALVLEKREKKKKKKKNEESCNHTLPELDVEDRGFQVTASVEPAEMSSSTMNETAKKSTKQKNSKNGKSDELTGLTRNEVSFREKSEKKKKKKKANKEEKNNKEGNNYTSKVLTVEDHGLRDTTSAEPAIVSSSKNKETTNKFKRQENPESGKPHEMNGFVRNGASVTEAVDSSTIPDHNSCTSKKRRLSSGNIRVSSENTQLAARNTSRKESESNMPLTNEDLTSTDFNSPALNNDRAQPIFKPIWRGSISVKQGKICSIDGLVGHLSSLACHQVHQKASSLHARLYAEMFPRLEIWPDSFLKKGPPTDKSIALYFFPSSESNDERVYYSLVCEMKKNDLALRCVLDNVDLLLFTSYQLPMYCWTFHSKEYLWGIFRRRKTLRH